MKERESVFKEIQMITKIAQSALNSWEEEKGKVFFCFVFKGPPALRLLIHATQFITETTTALVATNTKIVHELEVLKQQLCVERENHLALLHTERDSKEYLKARSDSLTNQLGKALVDFGEIHMHTYH